MARNVNASYESGDNRRITLSGIATDLSGKSFATLNAFVTATDTTEIQTNRGYSFKFCDTGGWCPMGIANEWYRCMMVRYQHSAGGAYGVQGSVLLAYGGVALWYGEISGTGTYTVQWVALKDNGAMRSGLSSLASTLNGHFLASPTGWTSLTSHANGDMTKRYRVQFQSNGLLQYYESTDSGATWTVIGEYVRSDTINTWTSRTITKNDSYIGSIGYSTCYCNTALKLATVNLSFGVDTVAVSGSVLLSGLPKPVATRATGCVTQGTATAPALRLYVNSSGQLIADDAIPATGWYNGSLSYPYSSL